MLCKIPLPKDRKIDGKDLMRYMNGVQDENPHDRLYWRTDHIHAIRYESWKLILSTRDNWLHLYNLKNDKSEKIDLSVLKEDEKARLFTLF